LHINIDIDMTRRLRSVSNHARKNSTNMLDASLNYENILLNLMSLKIK